jgi:hypothetical protein
MIHSSKETEEIEATRFPGANDAQQCSGIREVLALCLRRLYMWLFNLDAWEKTWVTLDSSADEVCLHSGVESNLASMNVKWCQPRRTVLRVGAIHQVDDR